MPVSPYHCGSPYFSGSGLKEPRGCLSNPTAKAVSNSPALIAQYADRSEEHTSELQSLMRISYAVFCLKKKKTKTKNTQTTKNQQHPVQTRHHRKTEQKDN